MKVNPITLQVGLLGLGPKFVQLTTIGLKTVALSYFLKTSHSTFLEIQFTKLTKLANLTNVNLSVFLHILHP